MRQLSTLLTVLLAGVAVAQSAKDDDLANAFGPPPAAKAFESEHNIPPPPLPIDPRRLSNRHGRLRVHRHQLPMRRRRRATRQRSFPSQHDSRAIHLTRRTKRHSPRTNRSCERTIRPTSLPVRPRPLSIGAR